MSGIRTHFRIIAGCAVILAGSLASGEKAPFLDFPNHHIHNFGVNEHTYEHAVAMGYRFVQRTGAVDPESKPEYRRLGLIRNHNAHICPVRIHKRKSDGKLFVTYHTHAGVTAEGLNPVALQIGVRRQAGGNQPTEMNADDLRVLKGYGAARKDVSSLSMADISYEAIQELFYTSWPLENREFDSCNVLCNWQSRKAVNDMIKATIENIDWKKYDALFLDSLSGGPPQLANKDFGGEGSYPTGPDGKLAFAKAVTEFVRDPKRTGCPRPYLVFTNIYDPLSEIPPKTWYASGELRLDHYYFEKGSKDEGSYLTHQGYELGKQYANGVVPGTTQPAFVNLDENGQPKPGAWLPANRVALDDAYTWSMRVSKRPNFDHAAFFDQHLDACGTAGIQGSWFGWYGEDNVTTRDTEGRLIYSNACQLLRAIPNWDNMRGIPVPPFNTYASTDQRRWDGKVYQSPYSYASHDVVYSRNPDTEELYVVFLKPRATVRLLPGEEPLEAWVVNPWFTKTTEDAMPILDHDGATGTLRSKDAAALNRGIRIVTTRSVNTTDNIQ